MGKSIPISLMLGSLFLGFAYYSSNSHKPGPVKTRKATPEELSGFQTAPPKPVTETDKQLAAVKALFSNGVVPSKASINKPFKHMSIDNPQVPLHMERESFAVSIPLKGRWTSTKSIHGTDGLYTITADHVGGEAAGNLRILVTFKPNTGPHPWNERDYAKYFKNDITLSESQQVIKRLINILGG